MRRTFLFAKLLAVILVLLLAVACSDGNDGEKSSGRPATTAKNEASSTTDSTIGARSTTTTATTQSTTTTTTVVQTTTTLRPYCPKTKDWGYGPISDIPKHLSDDPIFKIEVVSDQCSEGVKFVLDGMSSVGNDTGYAEGGATLTAMIAAPNQVGPIGTVLYRAPNLSGLYIIQEVKLVGGDGSTTVFDIRLSEQRRLDVEVMADEAAGTKFVTVQVAR